VTTANDPYYRSTVLRLGAETEEFFQGGILIFFAEPVPEQLESVSIIHRPAQPPSRPLAPGDRIRLGETDIVIRAVGELASENLTTLGHLVLYFDGAQTALLPGAVHVEAVAPPPLRPGDTLELRRAT
jgi:PTS system glucitol/sorbitol-specific IIA component